MLMMIGLGLRRHHGRMVMRTGRHRYGRLTGRRRRDAQQHLRRSVSLIRERQ